MINSLQYCYKNDAGYDLVLNLEDKSPNTLALFEFLSNYISPNLKFYSRYLPKLYINTEYIGELTDERAVSQFISYQDQEPCVLLPPARVGHSELSSFLCDYPNTQLVKTSFDFELPTKWTQFIELLKATARTVDLSIVKDKAVFYDYFESNFEEYLNFVGYVFPRSGLGTKHQIAISNNVGVVDAEYTNNVMVGLENRGRDFHLFTNGSRIAQLVLGVILNNPYNVEPSKSKTRELSGFGSTGV